MTNDELKFDGSIYDNGNANVSNNDWHSYMDRCEGKGGGFGN